VVTAHEHGWVRAMEHLAGADLRLRRLTVGAQLAMAAAFVIGAVTGLPGRAGWQQVLLAICLACSAYTTDALARRRRRPENHVIAQLPIIVGIMLAGLVGPHGSAAAGALALVLLVLTSAPYLERMHAVVLVGACSAAALAVLVATDRSALPASWFALVAVLALAVALVAALRRDGRLLRDVVQLEAIDPGTGLPNGRYLEQAAADAFAHASPQGPLAVLALEIDRLHDLDHLHGFRVGDDVLAAVAGRLRRELREVDVLARDIVTADADGDGDVLVALLPGVDETIAWEVALMLRARAAQRSNGVPAVTLSVGLAVYPPAQASAAEGTAEASSAPRLLARARQALVDAQRAGGDRVQAAGRSLRTAGTTRV
jgi:diguanylate cyclase (GGDEF)-like protein